MSIAPYLDLITSEHREQPNYIAWLSAALNKVDDGMTVLNGMIVDFTLDNAIGAQLDVIGQIAGVNRNVGVQLSSGSSILDDTHYLLIIKAAIARNMWDGTIPSIYSLWTSIFPNSQLQIIDNQDMTMQAIVTGLDDTVSQELVSNGFIIPKPFGVELTIIEQTNITEQTYSGALVGGGYDVVQLTTVSY